MPKVDICVPTYNSKPEHLKKALDSALEQTFEDWALWINDDPTDADVHKIVEPYLSDSRISFTRSATRLGIGGNWNATMQQGSAPYICFLFQDDYWDAQYLERVVKAFDAHPNVGLVASEHRYEYEDKVGGTNIKKSAGGLYEELRSLRKDVLKAGFQSGKEFLKYWVDRELHPNIIGEPPFVALRRSTVEQVGPFLTDMNQFLDTEYWLRILQVSNWYFVAEDMGAFRVHPDQATAQNQASGAGIYDRLRTFEILIASLSGEEKKRAIQARNSAFETMVRKYFERKKSGMNVSVGGAGGGAMKAFALKHPWLVMKTLFKVKFTST